MAGYSYVPMWEAEARDLKAKIAAQAALIQEIVGKYYIKHHILCLLRQGADDPSARIECTCGLAALIARAKAMVE